MRNYVQLLILAIPLLIYVLSSVTVPKNVNETPAGFFTAFRQVSTTPFANSSIAYAFQVATAYPFLTWAVAGIVLLPALNAVFWGIGIILFSMALPRLSALFGTDNTLHSFLGSAYGSKAIQLTTSILTIVGLLGIALGEITWGSQAIAVVVRHHDTTYLIMAIMVLCVFAYIGIGGQASSMRTDQLQLIFAYVGVLSLMGVLFMRTWGLHRVSELTRWAGAGALLYSVAIVISRRGKILVRTDTLNSFGMYTTRVANVLTVFAFAAVILGATRMLPLHASLGPLLSTTGFGLPGVLSMLLLPLGFQFVDMTNWQRMLGLQGASEQAVASARRGLRQFALESPFTWVIFLMLGAVAADAFPALHGSSNVLTDLPRALFSTGSRLDYWSSMLFLTGILGIMLSTVDSVLIAAMFTFIHDTAPMIGLGGFDWFASGDRARAVLNKARLFGLIMLAGGVACYILLDWQGHSGAAFIGALFAIYSAQLAMLPLVLGALFLPTPPKGVIVLSGLILSAGTGIGFGLYSTFMNPGWQWWPVPACLGTGFLIYTMATLIGVSSTKS